MKRTRQEKRQYLSIKRKMLIDLAINGGGMSPTDVGVLLHVRRSYVYKVIGKK